MRPTILALALLAAVPVGASGELWSVDLEAVQLELSGHDREVLVDRAIDPGGATSASAVTLETGDALAYRAELRYSPGSWSWGLDFLSHRTSQDADRRSGTAVAGGERIFVVGGGQVASDDPSEQLYFERLEDTTVELWTLDLHASRAFASGPQGELRWLVGLRAADFDNDYRAIAGVEGVGGLRLDASSNYDRMHGPLVGLAGRFERGRNRFEGYLGQSVVWGDVELTSGVREFVGPPSRDVDDVPGVVGESRFKTTESVSIPITELRLAWRYRITQHLALGAGAFASRWWDVAVPPGVEAGSTIETLDESTIDLLGLSAGVTFRF
ncbi:MAG TPA: hypothetical protein VI942_05200 [Thermoanaerobaculia bacterium]|nr:hypothetical protein [Thermoanaerobaculia bacterium]